LTAWQRHRLRASQFALPAERKYPIEDEAHARDALARVAEYGTAAEKRKVRAAVKRKYPDMEVQG
jgi:hypothetical protein